MSKQMDALIERAGIEDNKQFQRLSEKTQVVSPQNGMSEVLKNRATHSYEVATSSKILAASLSSKTGKSLKEIDFQSSVENASLLHDIGHPPFGHDGAHFLDEFFKARGLEEGFTDNNNNLTVIEKNGIEVRDYVLASIIKYPGQLYENQKSKYLPMLRDALLLDREHFQSIGIDIGSQQRTIACQIMDEADRNSYVCSDLSDFLSIGNTLNIKKLMWVANPFGFKNREMREMRRVIEVANDGNKSDIKSYFGSLKQKFNMNHTLGQGGVGFEDSDLHAFREFLNRVSYEYYIKPIRRMPAHDENMMKLSAFTHFVLEEEHYPSQHYKALIEGTDDISEKLTLIRDMVSEVSDWYIINEYRELGLDKMQSIETQYSNSY